MSNRGFIRKKKVAEEIAKLYNSKGFDLFDSGGNQLCTRLKIKPMHRNKLGGGTGEMLK